MRVFIPFPPEDSQIVIKALKFTKGKILDYHSEWIRHKPRIIHEDIDRKRSRLDEHINGILKILEDPPEEIKMRRIQELDYIHEIISSALYIYSLEYEKALDPDLPSSEMRYNKIKGLMNSARLKNSITTIFLEYYRGYSVKETSEKKLLFFSYSTRDKKAVGKNSGHP